MDKYIFKKERLLNQFQCNHIISLFESTDSLYNVNSARGYIGYYPRLDTHHYKFIGDAVFEALKEYRKNHLFLKECRLPWSIFPLFHIQKYLPGRAYDTEHCEHGWFELNDEYHQHNRILGWMIYLNDITEGGGTCWPQQEFISKPGAGDLYIWPAAWTHSHYGVPAPKELKYIITGWCNYNPRDPRDSVDKK